MRVTILGSGTSTGVPVVGCSCDVCKSEYPKDKRGRASILVEDEVNATRLLIDTGPDVRSQLLRHNIESLDVVLYTHSHYDHMGGINDLRPFSFHKGIKNSSEKNLISCLCSEQTEQDMKQMHPYIFREDIKGQISLDISTYSLNEENIYNSFYIRNIKVQPIRLMHVVEASMESVGFVFNQKAGYLTDFKWIFPEYEKFLKGLDVLILGAPIYSKHPTHISIPQALDLIKKFSPRNGVVTHLSHGLNHQDLISKFPEDVQPAYDDMSVTCN